MRRVTACLAALCLTTQAACSTIFLGTEQDLEIRTEPPGLRVELASGASCTSPCELEVERNSGDSVFIGDEDCGELISVEPTFSGGALALSFLGMILGIAIDASTGALYKVEPNPVEVTLGCAQ